jgi:hypothetical protein
MSESTKQPESTPSPHIGIEYRNLDPKDSILNIDSQKLESALELLGIPVKNIRKIVIAGGKNMEPTAMGGTLAAGNPLEKSITIYQNEIVEGLIERNQNMQRRLGIYPKEPLQEKLTNDFITPLVKKLFPSNWVYSLMGRSDEFNFYVNKERRKQYIENATNPGLVEDADKAEKLERAKHFLSGQIRRNTDRYMAWVMAHETEHFHDQVKKKLIPIGLAATSVTGGMALIQATEHLVPQQINNIDIIGFLGIATAVLFSVAKGKGMEERTSYDASDEHFREFFDSISINPDVYEKLVLNKVEESISQIETIKQ